LQDPPKFTQISIFGLIFGLHHLATLLGILFTLSKQCFGRLATFLKKANHGLSTSKVRFCF
jgi:hypothetical protein